jgi:hypothetical protein
MWNQFATNVEPLWNRFGTNLAVPNIEVFGHLDEK